MSAPVEADCFADPDVDRVGLALQDLAGLEWQAGTAAAVLCFRGFPARLAILRFSERMFQNYI